MTGYDRTQQTRLVTTCSGDINFPLPRLILSAILSTYCLPHHSTTFLARELLMAD